MDEVENIMHPLVVEFSENTLLISRQLRNLQVALASVFVFFYITRIISSFNAKGNFPVSNFCIFCNIADVPKFVVSLSCNHWNWKSQLVPNSVVMRYYSLISCVEYLVPYD